MRRSTSPSPSPLRPPPARPSPWRRAPLLTTLLAALLTSSACDRAPEPPAASSDPPSTEDGASADGERAAAPGAEDGATAPASADGAAPDEAARDADASPSRASVDAAPAGALPGVIVSAAWLAEHRDGVLLLDARDEAAYLGGHLPGAVHLPPERLNAGASVGDLASPEVVGAALGAAGLRRDAQVVVYGADDDYRPSARIFWALEVHGHDRVAVLDGGVEGWVAAGQALSTEPVTPTPAVFEVTFDPARVVDAAGVQAALTDSSVVIIDARGASHYTGESGPEGLARQGHIPGARSVPAASTLVERDGVMSLPDAEVLRQHYEDVAEGARAITYCNNGRSASVSYLELRAMGVEAAVYDGSWTDWSARDDLPHATGEAPGAVASPAGE